MTQRNFDGSPPDGYETDRAPLPRDWLPEARPHADDSYWDAFATRVVTEWRSVHEAPRRDEPGAVNWIAEIGERWRAAGVLAAAAAAVLLSVGLQERAAAPTDFGTEDLALRLLAAEGDPAAMWTSLGIPADPALAWLTLDGGPPE